MYHVVPSNRFHPMCYSERPILSFVSTIVRRLSVRNGSDLGNDIHPLEERNPRISGLKLREAFPLRKRLPEFAARGTLHDTVLWVVPQLCMIGCTFNQTGQGFLDCDSATEVRLQGQACWQLTIDKLTRSLGQTQEIEPHQSPNSPTQRCPHRRHSRDQRRLRRWVKTRICVPEDSSAITHFVDEQWNICRGSPVEVDIRRAVDPLIWAVTILQG